jgi:hypothetical protein
MYEYFHLEFQDRTPFDWIPEHMQFFYLNKVFSWILENNKHSLYESLSNKNAFYAYKILHN